MENVRPQQDSDVGSTAAKSPPHTLHAMRQLLAAIISDLGSAVGAVGTAAARLISTTRWLFAAIGSNVANAAPKLRSSALRIGTLTKWGFLGVILSCLVGAVAMLWALYPVPLDERPGPHGSSVIVEAANGDNLGRIGMLRDPAGRNDFPDLLVKAVLSIEDRRFYSHWGIDPRGIARAIYANWSAASIVEGGSTLTQQFVKIQFVGNDRSLDRKLREALTAVWLDRRLGKEEILSRYLNSVYLGAGAYGMRAAARVYFDKDLSELTLSESAMLAGLIQAPSRYDPTRNLDAAQARAALVLDAMVETGAINSNLAAAAKAEPATIKVSADAVRAGSWFADWIAKYELRKIAGEAKRTVRVRTTLEPQVQRVAERSIREALTRPGEARGASEAALVAMRPNGSVIAMVGGRDYDESQFNRAVDAKRQPGSTFKVFVYYAALKKGYSPDSIIDASPVVIGAWQPENYGGHQFGPMGLSQAFAQSVNTAAVRLAMAVGLKEVIAAARELGLDASLKEVPSMALGSNEVTLLDLTGAFASIRAGRPKLEPWGITAFASEPGGLRSLGAPAAAKVGLPRNDELTHLLRDVVQRGTGRAAAIDGVSVAGKTGTSQDYRDAWFVGFTDQLVVGVWVGNDDRSPMKGMTGGSLPAQIWKSFVTAATPLLGNSNKPEVAEAGEPSGSKDATSQPQCNQNACAAQYNSFRASDCTYQPYSGARRLCDIPESTVPRTRAALKSDSAITDRSRSAARQDRPRTDRETKEVPSRTVRDYEGLRDYMLR